MSKNKYAKVSTLDNETAEYDPKPQVSQILLDRIKLPYEMLSTNFDEEGNNCVKLLFSHTPYLMMHVYPDGAVNVCGTTKSGKFYSNNYSNLDQGQYFIKERLDIWRNQGIR